VNYRESYNLHACNGILFNHESPRRGETFVTRKITRGLANIKPRAWRSASTWATSNALRDWGHAKDYVRMHVAHAPAGIQYTVRDFVRWSAAELGLNLRFEGEGLDEHAIVSAIEGDRAPALKVGDILVRVDPRYFRPTEVETLLGDPLKAKERLGWVPEITVQELCAEMVAEDLKIARRHAFLKANGHDTPLAVED
jgi:GDPmannose 4,6-dehydratase